MIDPEWNNGLHTVVTRNMLDRAMEDPAWARHVVRVMDLLANQPPVSAEWLFVRGYRSLDWWGRVWGLTEKGAEARLEAFRQDGFVDRLVVVGVEPTEGEHRLKATVFYRVRFGRKGGRELVLWSDIAKVCRAKQERKYGKFPKRARNPRRPPQPTKTGRKRTRRMRWP